MQSQERFMEQQVRPALLTVGQALEYEIAGSSWAGRLSFKWAQILAGWWFSRKVRSKYARYINAKAKMMKANRAEHQIALDTHSV